MIRKSITMKDIAEKLNISIVTVSKALSDKEGVSEELKEKIKSLATQMGYRFNTVAKSMKDGLSYNIGIVVPERFIGRQQSFYLKFHRHVSQALETYGYYGILQILTPEDEEQLVLPRFYCEKRVDGMIILGQVSKAYIEILQSTDTPVVFLDFYDEHSNVDAVITDSFYAAYELTNYVIRSGNRKLAFVGNIYATSSIQDRFLGYYKSLIEHRIDLDHDYVLSDRDEHGKFIDIELPEIMPEAFVCNCDEVAYNLILKLQKLGYRVPEDVSVVGFDNDIYATISTPQITTVEVDMEEMGRIAIKVLINKINRSTKEYGRLLVKAKLIVRESVKVKRQEKVNN
ncbi:MAG: substrate-binding domain-containing protein [Clostridia bacterium]|nr:substrate-binding domain-containing protein [Clostridia bacterium]